ncbi:glycosyltransferase family 2 protein [Labilibacter sediminis]|nr:glycosyltransferase family 2 protein [Labilibacter sediminis]
MLKKQSKSPFFSVIIPMYNAELYIKQTINAVLSQSFEHYEVLIIDDGSTDKSAEHVSGFDDKRIRLISQANGGVSSARNKGLAFAKGKYIAFLDADDHWYSDHLQQAYDFFSANSNINWFISNHQVQKYTNNPTQIIQNEVKTEIINFIEYGYQFVWTSSVIIASELAISVGGFPLSCGYGEDSCYWYKIGIHSPLMAYSKKVTALRFIRDGSITQTSNRTSTYLLECIKARKNRKIKNDRALQGMMVSMLLYHFRNTNLMEFLKLYSLVPKSVGIKLSIRTLFQIPYALLLNK